MTRVQTGCAHCKRCTNSSAAEFGRRQAKLWLNVFLFGIPLLVQAFVPTCRGCGHQLSLHDRGESPRGNSYSAPVQVIAAPPAPPTPTTPAGWYPDPHGQPCLRWWDGTQWTNATAPARSPA